MLQAFRDGRRVAVRLKVPVNPLDAAARISAEMGPLGICSLLSTRVLGSATDTPVERRLAQRRDSASSEQAASRCGSFSAASPPPVGLKSRLFFAASAGKPRNTTRP